jgi:hypothetical protein
VQRGGEVFSGLAHFIKGGVFFWYGVLTLGRWAGCFADIGWVCYSLVMKHEEPQLMKKGVEHQASIEQADGLHAIRRVCREFLDILLWVNQRVSRAPRFYRRCLELGRFGTPFHHGSFLWRGPGKLTEIPLERANF